MDFIENNFDFKNKNILVAGGAGYLGTYISNELFRLGARVIVVDTASKPLEWETEIIYVQENNFTPNSVSKLINSVEDNFGPIFGFINCIASREIEDSEYFASIENYSIKTWESVLLGNLGASFSLCREIGLKMVTRKQGSIVNFSSIYSSDLGPDLRIYDNLDNSNYPMTTPIPYSVSKGGVVALTKHLACAWASSGVRVNSVSPGGVLKRQSQEFIRAYSARVPMGRMADPTEIVSLPIFLISNLSSYITGQNIYVDGGFSAW
jgi:NAD(P)-dependent dehydrogenase (short-subunit alcohol dehydrogenase family)